MAMVYKSLYRNPPHLRGTGGSRRCQRWKQHSSISYVNWESGPEDDDDDEDDDRG